MILKRENNLYILDKCILPSKGVLGMLSFSCTASISFGESWHDIDIDIGIGIGIDIDIDIGIGIGIGIGIYIYIDVDIDIDIEKSVQCWYCWVRGRSYWWSWWSGEDCQPLVEEREREMRLRAAGLQQTPPPSFW